MSLPRLCVLSVHTTSHSNEDCILNQAYYLPANPPSNSIPIPITSSSNNTNNVNNNNTSNLSQLHHHQHQPHPSGNLLAAPIPIPAGGGGAAAAHRHHLLNPSSTTPPPPPQAVPTPPLTEVLFKPQELILIYDPEHPMNRLILRVPPPTQTPRTLEISIQKTLAESIGLIQFSKVIIERITTEEAELDFVELSFKKQYLQRGNMFRFKQSLLGRTIHMNQNITIHSMQAQIQDLKKNLSNQKSGLITEQTKFVFRSKSSRIIWLIQISAEMWDIDQNGDLYFDKFLKEFVGPLFDSWKHLGVSHMLTVIFFARTIFLDRITATSHPDLTSKRSVNYNNGYHQQDFLKIVVENIHDIDKVSLIKQLKHEFWAFPQILGWRIPHWKLELAAASKDQYPFINNPNNTGSNLSKDLLFEEEIGIGKSKFGVGSPIQIAVPSDAVHGNFLGAINTSLNILEKHYMDRDLTRTGNSIVMVSAGAGVFKVKPNLSQITKQRMLDSAFGIDFISLSRPPLHTVPLFIVSSPVDGGKDFYEVPHWIRVSYIDRKKDLEELDSGTIDTVSTTRKGFRDNDQLWADEYLPHPLSFLLTSILTYSSNFQSLAKSYVQYLPFALKELLYHLCEQSGQCRSLLIKVDRELTPPISRPLSYANFPSLPLQVSTPTPASAPVPPPTPTLLQIPMWGKIAHFPRDGTETKKASDSFSTKTMLLQQDIVKLRLVSQKATSETSGFTNTTKRLLMDILDSVPILTRDREDSLSASLSSNPEGILGTSAGTDDLEASNHGLARSLTNSYLGNSYEEHRFFTTMQKAEAKKGGSAHFPIHIEGTSSEQILRLDMKPVFIGNSNSVNQQKYYQDLIEEKAKLADILNSKTITKDALQEFMNAHDKMMDPFFSRIKPDTSIPPVSDKNLPAIEEGGIAAIEKPSSRTESSSLESNPPPAPMASPKGILKNSSSSNLLGGSDNPRPVEKKSINTIPIAPPPTSKPVNNEPARLPYMNPIMGKANNPRMQYTPNFRGNLLPPQLQNQLAKPPVSSEKDESTDKNLSDKSNPDKPVEQNSLKTTGEQTQDNPVISPEKELVSNPAKTISPNQPQGMPAAARKNNKFSSKNFIARNQILRGPPVNSARPRPGGPESNDVEKVDFVIEHGKIVPVPIVDPAKKKKEDILEYLKNYSSQYGINPFRQKEGEKYLNQMTHNRRRWSHVFPSNKNERPTDYGLNYKSLTQPAILPLTTDYLPPVKDLEKNYNVHQYILTIDKRECPFPSLESALQELVCQRLSREFQMVEGFDKSTYIRVNKYDMLISDQSKRDSFYQNFFILTMGHRIHFLLGDVKENQIYVTSFLSKKSQILEEQDGRESTEGHIDSLTSFQYHYEMWVSFRRNFQTVSQKFYQFPKKEYLWNQLDNLIVGNLDYDANIVDDLRSRYVHFIIIPKNITTEEEMNEYYSKIDSFVEVVNKYAYDKNEDLVNITKEKTLLQYANPLSTDAPLDHFIKPSPFSTNGQSTATAATAKYWVNKPHYHYRNADHRKNACKLLMRSKEGGNPNWSYFRYDQSIYPYKIFHIEIQWFVADSWLIDDFVTLLFRRAGRFGLRLVQTPSYFNSNNLNIHPYRPAPYIAIPSTQPTNIPVPMVSSLTNTLAMAGSNNSSNNNIGATITTSNNPPSILQPTPSLGSLPNPGCFTIPLIHSSALRLIERLYFIHSKDWVYDGEECTKWDLIELPIPNYSDRDRDILSDDLLFPGNTHNSNNNLPPKAPNTFGSFNAGNDVITPKPGGPPTNPKSMQRSFLRAKSGDEESLPPPPTNVLDRKFSTNERENFKSFPPNTPGHPLLNQRESTPELSEPSGFARNPNSPMPLNERDRNSSNAVAMMHHSQTNTSQGNVPTKKIEKPENKRIDRQYVHILGIATVRVAANGFLWFSSSTTKLSDINQSVEEKTIISTKALKSLESLCNSINDIYEIVLEVIDRCFLFGDCKDYCYDIVDNLEEEKKKLSSPTMLTPRSESFVSGPNSQLSSPTRLGMKTYSENVLVGGHQSPNLSASSGSRPQSLKLDMDLIHHSNSKDANDLGSSKLSRQGLLPESLLSHQNSQNSSKGSSSSKNSPIHTTEYPRDISKYLSTAGGKLAKNSALDSSSESDSDDGLNETPIHVVYSRDSQDSRSGANSTNKLGSSGNSYLNFAALDHPTLFPPGTQPQEKK